MYSTPLGLLDSARYGSIAFAVQSVPVVCPASHLAGDDELIVRFRRDGLLTTHRPDWAAAATGFIASYVTETPERMWRVVVTGMAFPIGNRTEAAGYARLLPNLARLPVGDDHVIRLHMETIASYRQRPRPAPEKLAS
jgi:hypothetical protein